jgi:hypothetical protein
MGLADVVASRYFLAMEANRPRDDTRPLLMIHHEAYYDDPAQQFSWSRRELKRIQPGTGHNHEAEATQPVAWTMSVHASLDHELEDLRNLAVRSTDLLRT